MTRHWVLKVTLVLVWSALALIIWDSFHRTPSVIPVIVVCPDGSVEKLTIAGNHVVCEGAKA